MKLTEDQKSESRPLPIFKPSLRQAIRDGSKTQTRRVVKFTGTTVLDVEQRRAGFIFNSELATAEDIGKTVAALADLENSAVCQQLSVPFRHPNDSHVGWDDCPRSRLYCPYGKPGDIAYLREPLWRNRTLVQAGGQEDVRYADTPEIVRYPPGDFYVMMQSREASDKMLSESDDWSTGAWTSMTMPRWAARTFVRLTEVRVERLQDITEAGAMAEGAEPILVPPDGGSCPYLEGFEVLWQSINGEESWAANPWVWVVKWEPI